MSAAAAVDTGNTPIIAQRVLIGVTKTNWMVCKVAWTRAGFAGYKMLQRTSTSERVFAGRVMRFRESAGGRSMTEQRPGIKCRCHDTVPPAVNVLAVWVIPERQASAISKETYNNKQAQE